MKKKHSETTTIGSSILQAWLQFTLRWHSDHHWALNWNPYSSNRPGKLTRKLAVPFTLRGDSGLTVKLQLPCSVSWRWWEMREKSVTRVFKAPLLAEGYHHTAGQLINLHQIKRSGRHMALRATAGPLHGKSPPSLRRSNSQRRKLTEWWLQGAGGGRNGKFHGCRVSIWDDEKDGWRWWLYNNVTVLNATQLHT